jgi:hypothetical protein
MIDSVTSDPNTLKTKAVNGFLAAKAQQKVDHTNYS